jgi:hypothetical protein
VAPSPSPLPAGEREGVRGRPPELLTKFKRENLYFDNTEYSYLFNEFEDET